MANSSKEKKSGGFKGFFGRFGRYLRDTRGEMKRVVWPGKTQVINNTGIVLVFMALMAIIVGVFDMLLQVLLTLFFGLSA